VITVGLPCYNEARNLPGLLDDVLAQELDDELEILIVDDASDDATSAIASAFAARDARIRVQGHAVRRGSTAAWNSVFAHSRGDVLVRLDGDVRLANAMVIGRLAAPLRERPVEPRLSYCAVVPRDPPATWVARGTGFIYRYIARQNAMGRATPESLLCAVLGASVGFYRDFRIPETIVANDYFTARSAASRGVRIDIVDAIATIKPSSTLEDFRRQARRMAGAHRQIDDALGETPRTAFAALPAIVVQGIFDPFGAASFLRLRSEIRVGAANETAWETAESTK